MPAYPDLYKNIHGKMPSGPKWEAFNWLVSLIGVDAMRITRGGEEQTLLLIDRQSDFQQSGFTLRLGNRGKTTE